MTDMNDEQKKLAEENISLVYFTLKKYFSPNVHDDEDCIAAGMEGLCIAAEGFDPDKGKFSTYAAQCIRNTVRTELRSRQKHLSNIYLSNVTASEETDTTFEEYHGGDDPGYMDVETNNQIDEFETILTIVEKDIFRKTRNGKSPLQISEETGLTRSKVYSVLREIKMLWKLYRRTEE